MAQCTKICLDALVVSNLLQTYGLYPTRLLYPWDFPGTNAGVGCHFLLQGIFSTGPGIKFASPALAGKFFITEPPVKPKVWLTIHLLRDVVVVSNLKIL